MLRKLTVTLALVIGLGLAVGTTNALSSQLAGLDQTTTTLPYDEFVIATYGEPNTLDPAWNYESAGDDLIRQIYDPLITLERDKTDTFVPMLATDWDVSPDGKMYTFNIRTGVKFHNGNDLTPQDVAYTFQRGVLQGNGPQWLFTEALFGYGVYDVCNVVDDSVCYDRAALQALQSTDPALVASPCISLTNAIVADDENWQVSIELEQPWGALLNSLVDSWGSIVDKDWAIANGGWDGDCGTWQDYYNDTPIPDVANGTGPFMLDHWTPGVEVVLIRNPNYWRMTPIWDYGPSGPAAFASITRLIVPSETVRKEMLLNGLADMASISSQIMPQLNDDVLYAYDKADGLVPSLENPTGTLKLYRGGFSPSATDAFFTFDIRTDGPNNYIGSGVWDGHGIPTDFFSDIHVRKGFNYAFDWNQYIADIYNGQAIQRTGPIIYGLMGYSETQPTFYYSPTLALQELNQAWGGLVATNGFSLTIAYNTGNQTRQRVAELVQAGVEALDPSFHIEVVSMPWNIFSSEINNSRLPIFINGWIQDIPHPQNWVQPWTIGTYGSSQRMPAPMRQVYETKVNACIQLSGEAARLCYEDIQETTYNDVLDIFLAQPRQRTYLRAEMQGYYHSQVNGGPLTYYALSKGPPPIAETVTPATEHTIEFTSTLGAVADMAIPSGSVNESMDIVISPDVVANGEPAGFKLGDLSFEILAHDASGAVIENPTLNNPIIITIQYTPQVINQLDEATLGLFWWDGDEWVDAACGAYVRDLENSTLEVPICHLSAFALGGVRYDVMLPFVASGP